MKGRNINGRFISNNTFMAWLFLDIIFFIFFLGLIESKPGEIISPLPSDYKYEAPKPNHSTDNEKRDTTSAVIDRYFKRKGSPLNGLGTVFYDLAEKYGYHPYLLVSVSMAESSGAKNYIKSTKNFMGWGHGRIEFNSFRDCLETIAYKISTLGAYRNFREEKSVSSFALAYNAPFAQSYAKTLWGFINELKLEEIK